MLLFSLTEKHNFPHSGCVSRDHQSHSRCQPIHVERQWNIRVLRWLRRLQYNDRVSDTAADAKDDDNHHDHNDISVTVLQSSHIATHHSVLQQAVAFQQPIQQQPEHSSSGPPAIPADRNDDVPAAATNDTGDDATASHHSGQFSVAGRRKSQCHRRSGTFGESKELCPITHRRRHRRGREVFVSTLCTIFVHAPRWVSLQWSQCERPCMCVVCERWARRRNTRHRKSFQQQQQTTNNNNDYEIYKNNKKKILFAKSNSTRHSVLCSLAYRERAHKPASNSMIVCFALWNESSIKNMITFFSSSYSSSSSI